MAIIPIMNSLKRLVPILGLLVLLAPARLSCQAPEPVVHAVLFFHPTCPHCHELINEHLMPLQNQYGDRLVLLGMDTSQSWANGLYWEAIRFYEVPQEDWVVPMLVVAGEVLIGGEEIPRRLLTIIEEGLAGDGVDVPDYPALVTFLREQNALDPRYPDRLITRPAPVPEPEASAPATDSVVAEDSLPSATPSVVEDPPVAADTASEEVPAVSETPAAEAPAVSDPTSNAPVDEDPKVGDPAAEVPVAEAPVVEAPVVEAPVADPTAGQPVEVDSAQAGMGEAPGGHADDPAAVVPQEDSPPVSVGSMDLSEAARELDSMTMWDRFNLDRTGSSVAVLVLFGMIISLVLRGFPPRVRGGEWPGWVIPTLVVVGVFVAAYLSYIEITHAEAACGPVGDCNTVNQSKYATLFGVLPVGVLGLIGYGLIMALWLLRGIGSEEGRKVASLGLWGAALFGTLFSIYLTFLEPFVIGATCAWCLSSAVIMTLLLWASAPLAARAWPGSE